MKSLAIITVLLTVGIYLPPRCEAQQPTNKTAQQLADKSDPTTITYVDNRRDAAEKQPAQNKPPNGYVSPEWALVIVGIITFFVIGWQSLETRKAASAGQDSIKLQETAYKQWLELRDWNVVISEDEKWLNVTVYLINPTDFPVTLSLVKITLDIGQGVEAYLICKGRSLPPKEPVKMTVSGALSDIAKPNYFEGRLGIIVEGSLKFMSILERPESQDFKGMLSCGPNKTTFNYIIPDANQENQKG
jgi:hypothetical protein